MYLMFPLSAACVGMTASRAIDGLPALILTVFSVFGWILAVVLCEVLYGPCTSYARAKNRELEKKNAAQHAEDERSAMSLRDPLDRFKSKPLRQLDASSDSSRAHQDKKPGIAVEHGHFPPRAMARDSEPRIQVLCCEDRVFDSATAFDTRCASANPSHKAAIASAEDNEWAAGSLASCGEAQGVGENFVVVE